ncbi:valine--tRNA ligase [Flavihumibacter petaseus]|uniref:Valine--tRNA ligase n=1 Tax=Flavihumibacter petaseus NBRC 106054 TaxID=1220578 RepID=A0A0E9N233_9BACT|nr:valine--tRNA ligase [Flavihumibacter petaseus]GAO43721.1 valyl-tRNA synthetase [Flavihumibacter petaseus NBRC 106054]
MELSKNFNPATAEVHWTQHWRAKRYFNSKPDHRQPFTVVIPPPNVTGVLHMGHTLNETVQDILVRKARMSGFNACWVPGSDHASIATEAKVVQMLEKEKGIHKADLSREEFLKYAFEWKDKYGGIIYNQIERLGCSVDWDRVTFTMDDHYYKAVIKVFIDLYEKGLIYRGARMINWDPSAKTALSDEEVEYKEVQGKLYHIRYPLENGGELVIATQRPETIMGDTAICVNPEDPRYANLQGAYALVPLINRRIPVIFDTYVDPAFGTGALKVTPAHDINDYNLGLKHNLEVVDTLNDDGTLSEAAQIYIGTDRFKARKLIVAELEEKGFLIKAEDYHTRVGYSQRTGVVVEPKISTQWFLKMREMAEPALNAVLSGDIRIHPGDKFLATYRYWLENVKDWCISRQLWWGQQIPAWYNSDGVCVVAADRAGAVKAFAEKGISVEESAVTQDADVLDTWFSSWLWPMEVFNGITEPDNEEFKYYYPTSVLVTGQDIIFFWVARMVMAGMEYQQERPFRDVYFTGMVRDKQGRKMSKSLGNSPDLLELIDKYGADAVRFGIMISSPAGNDLLFDESALEQGRNFNNKMWNAAKLIQLWKEKATDVAAPSGDAWAHRWFETRLMEVRVEVEQLLAQFRLSEALKTIYSLIWDDFCSWYLEWIKPGFGEPMSNSSLQQCIRFFESLVQLLHPYMPFITEEIYHALSERKDGDDLCMLQFPSVEVQVAALENNAARAVLAEGQLLKNIISGLRDARNKAQLKPKETVSLFIDSPDRDQYTAIRVILSRQVNAASVEFTGEAIAQSITAVIGKERFYLQTEQPLETGNQKEDLLKELEYLKGFLASVEKKLGNERFVSNAKPEIVEMERRKQQDAEGKIKVIEESLATM